MMHPNRSQGQFLWSKYDPIYDDFDKIILFLQRLTGLTPINKLDGPYSRIAEYELDVALPFTLILDDNYGLCIHLHLDNDDAKNRLKELMNNLDEEIASWGDDSMMQ